MVGIIKHFVSENNSHASQIAENVFAIHDGLMPKVNHSCEPNYGIHEKASGAHDLISFRNIKPVDELSYDYVMRNYRIERFARKCQCGTKICRVTITGWRDLPPAIKHSMPAFQHHIYMILINVSRTYIVNFCIFCSSTIAA